ncbi:MAG: CidA/LrgA family protein [Acidobacteriota bacterium]|nr:CidA/LrgA family protein [Acidobacteriota bacterium]
MRYRTHLKLLPQVLLLALFWLVGEGVVRLTHLPLPGSIVGMFLLLGGLLFGAVPLRAVKGGAYLLLAEMLLFFIPAVLVVLDHGEFLGITGLKILILVLVSTMLVMASTGMTVQWLSDRQHRRASTNASH